MNNKVFFYVRNSKITNPKVIRSLFDPEGTGSISLKDGKYSLELLAERKNSNLQKGYFYGVIVNMVYDGLRNAGWETIRSKIDVVNFLKTKFLKKEIVNPNTGEVEEIIKGISELTTLEMTTFWEEIWQWAAEYLGITIPAPNSQASIEYFQ